MFIRMNDLVLVTYENEETIEFRFFEKTALHNGWKIVRIGEGEKWEGFVNKINGYMKFCSSLPDNTIVILSDARDVFCLRPPNAFTDAFNYMKADILVSAEIFCEGQIEVKEDYVGRQCVSLQPYYKFHNIKPHPIRKFVNSGLIAGKAKALRHMLQWIIDQNYTDDQLGVGMYMNAFPMNVRLDADAELLHTSTFGINGGVYTIHQQKHDAPNFAELFGCGAFFLHVPGYKNIKGQKLLYECVKQHLELHNTDELLKIYNEPPPPWDKYGDLKKLRP
jgi:hypothetical protein